jgi:hypothetical protein
MCLRVFVFFFKSSISGPGWTFPFHPGPLTDDLKEKQLLLATLHLLPPDDGLQMGSKNVEVW